MSDTTRKLMPRRALILVAFLMAAGMDHVLMAQYGGPSILSRGGNTPGRRGRAPINFNFYLGANGRYETGLLAPAVTEGGQIVPKDGYGAGGEWGFYGGHDWRRSSLGVDYRGDYRYLSNQQNFNGSNHALSLEYTHLLSRRVRLMLVETGGTSNRAFGGFAAPAFANIGRPGVPLNEVFDVRTYYDQTAAFLAIQKSARTTFIAGGQAFFVKRDSLALINAQGYMANGGVTYRLNRRDTIGAQYQRLQFDYPHVFSNATANIASLRWERQVTRSLNFDLSAGAYDLMSSGIERVQLSPEVAEILGRTTGVAAFRKRYVRPTFDMTVRYQQQRGHYYLNAQRGVGAGNGIFLATTHTTANTGYSYSGIRRTSLGLSAGWTRTESASLTLPSLTTWQAGTGASYQLREHLHATIQFDYRTFKSNATIGREGYSAMFGINYSSSRLPLSIW